MRRQRSSRWRAGALLGALVTVVLAVSCGSNAGPSPTEEPSPLPTLDAALVDQGRGIFLQSCASCHGAKAQGAPNWQQPDDRGNLPPPPHDDSGHSWRHGDAELREIIRNGLRDVFNKTPELTMPPFKDRLSDVEIAAVIEYVKSLWSPEHRQYQEEQNQRPSMGTPEAGR